MTCQESVSMSRQSRTDALLSVTTHHSYVPELSRRWLECSHKWFLLPNARMTHDASDQRHEQRTDHYRPDESGAAVFSAGAAFRVGDQVGGAEGGCPAGE